MFVRGRAWGRWCVHTLPPAPAPRRGVAMGPGKGARMPGSLRDLWGEVGLYGVYGVTWGSPGCLGPL